MFHLAMAAAIPPTLCSGVRSGMQVTLVSAGMGCAGLTVHERRLHTTRLLRLPGKGKQNSDDGTVCGEDAYCYGYDHSEREDEDTQQTTQVPAFFRIAAVAIPAFCFGMTGCCRRVPSIYPR